MASNLTCACKPTKTEITCMSHERPPLEPDFEGEPKNNIIYNMHSHACTYNLAETKSACMSHAKLPIRRRSDGDAQIVRISAMHALNRWITIVFSWLGFDPHIFLYLVNGYVNRLLDVYSLHVYMLVEIIA